MNLFLKFIVLIRFAHLVKKQYRLNFKLFILFVAHVSSINIVKPANNYHPWNLIKMTEKDAPPKRVLVERDSGSRFNRIVCDLI